MRKIIAGLFISLDGVVEAPETWHFPYFNEEMGKAVSSQMAEADTVLLGRTTYDVFAAHWPHQTGELADLLNNIPKYVVSTTLQSADWKNTTVIGDDVAARITELKQLPGENIAMTGSGTLIRFLLAHGLLDELRLLVHPIVLGAGERLFPEGTARHGLKLIRSETFTTGVLNTIYGPADQ
ncbi:MAG: dihydrofolate reductase family protein [Streptosporangiaceae bacterium]